MHFRRLRTIGVCCLLYITMSTKLVIYYLLPVLCLFLILPKILDWISSRYTSLCPDPIPRDISVLKSDHDSVPYTRMKMYEIVREHLWAKPPLPRKHFLFPGNYVKLLPTDVKHEFCKNVKKTLILTSQRLQVRSSREAQSHLSLTMCLWSFKSSLMSRERRREKLWTCWLWI